MSAPRRPASHAQAWIDLVADDPEAWSALRVARTLPGCEHLETLRRVRLVELYGVLPEPARIEELLHGSTQFYNPHKERCTLRTRAQAAAPLRDGERAVLVLERGGERRGAAERWWKHETRRKVEVREGVVWAARFEAGAPADALDALAVVRDSRHGLLCNPHAQEARPAADGVPFPWIRRVRAKRAAGAGGTS